MGRSPASEIIFRKGLDLNKKNLRWATHPILRQFSVKNLDIFLQKNNNDEEVTRYLDNF